ncbi:hypothetical protein [uncultured Kordia sp.]|uniref:hypothetical protein n=1 Tax=uncultured Kordia sp. TaxID=507699 RepID=UPI0026145327|nr:hypothetical protein [uncultured Kordia sp.]
MSIIHFSTVFKALDVFVEKHNAFSDDLSSRLRQPVIATAREIIRIYGASLFKASKKASFDTASIPPLATNNVQLAKISHTSTRTIKRHLKKLLKANVIIEKINYGRKANYELYLNPKILLINSEKAVNKQPNQKENKKLKKTDNQFFKKDYWTTCPQTDASNNSYINNILIAVDNKMNIDRSLSYRSSKVEALAGNNFTGYVEKEGGKRIKEPLSQGTPGARNLKRTNDVEKEGELPEVKTQAKDIDSRLEASGIPFLNSYVDILWELAKKKLYKEVCLTENVEKKTKELLYLWYQPVKKQHLDKVHNVYMKRIELVQKYLAKDSKNRFVQLPHLYFDTKNKNGFAGTKVWYEDHIRSKQKIRLKLITHAQIRRFLNNEQKNTINQKPRLALFKDCEKRIQQLGKPVLLNQFYTAVLNEKNKTVFISE